MKMLSTLAVVMSLVAGAANAAPLATGTAAAAPSAGVELAGGYYGHGGYHHGRPHYRPYRPHYRPYRRYYAPPIYPSRTRVVRRPCTTRVVTRTPYGKIVRTYKRCYY